MRPVPALSLPLAVGSVLLAAAPCAAEFVCATAPAARLEPAAKLASRPKAAPSPSGQVQALVLFADFADGEATGLPASPGFFGPNLPGSLTHYYDTMSAGRFRLDGVVASRRYRAGSPSSAYLATASDEYGDVGRFVYEVLEQADDDIDFTRFDNDGPDGIANSGDDDGWVDYLFVVVRTVPEGFIRGRATGVAGLGETVPFETHDRGIDDAPIRVSPERRAASVVAEGPFRQMVGAMAHEFAHAFDLPDLYDLAFDAGEDDSAGIGRWGLMGWGAHGWSGNDGPNEFSAWCLEQLGWINTSDGSLVDVVSDRRLRVRDRLHGGSVYRIELSARTTASGVLREYLLLEYRSRQRYYGTGMPGDGLLVWHVAPGRFTNEDETAKLVDLVCADGVYADAGYPQGRPGDGRIGGDNLDFWAHDAAYRHAHAGNEGDATDPFDGIRFTRLAIDTNPSSDIRGRLPTAAAGLELSLRRDGDAMVVDAVVPRWRGDIYERDVGWAKRVVVDGDLRVLPRGRLTIEAGTRVLVDDGDRLASGLDAEMVEIVVEGDLLLRGPNPVLGDIVFRALRPAGRWHGLVIRQAEGSQILAPGGGYRIEDARRDIYYAGAEDGGAAAKVLL